MRIGIVGLGWGELARPDVYGRIVMLADELGFDTLWLPEHLVMLSEFTSMYPYTRMAPSVGDSAEARFSAALPAYEADAANLNPYIALAFAAGRTNRIRLGTGVSLVPEYPPLVLAKLIGSVDHLSNGRLVLGMGLGWLKEEYEALGIPWERRGARAKEYVRALREVWGTHTSSFSGEFVEFRSVLSFPKPQGGASFPVIYGGNTELAARRAAEYCDGLFLVNLTPAEVKERVAIARAHMTSYGRHTERFEVIVTGVSTMTPRDLAAYQDAGADEVNLAPDHYYEAGLDPRRFAPPGGALAEQIGEAMRVLADTWLTPAAELSATSR